MVATAGTSREFGCGDGGGGGPSYDGGTITGTAMNGAAGGVPGGGGGSGGAGYNQSSGGAGGVGAIGQVRIWAW